MTVKTFQKDLSDVEIVLNPQTTIKKSYEVVNQPMQLIQLNKGLNLRQQRFFNLAILKVENGISTISHSDFKKVFSDEADSFFNAAVVNDIEKLVSLNIQTESETKTRWENVFLYVEYNKSISSYEFSWSPFMEPRIANVVGRYIQQDLKILANFRNKYSFIWYDYFKAGYRQWKYILSKEDVMRLLQVSDVKSYKDKHSVFFKQCISGPIEELNKHTEYNITVELVKKGRNVVGYEFKRGTKDGVQTSASAKQIETARGILDAYGDMTLIVKEIASLTLIIPEKSKELMDLFFAIETYKPKLKQAEEGMYSIDGFSEVVAELIALNKKFKDTFNAARKFVEDRPTIDVFLGEQEHTNAPRSTFYNWLDERE